MYDSSHYDTYIANVVYVGDAHDDDVDDVDDDDGDDVDVDDDDDDDGDGVDVGVDDGGGDGSGYESDVDDSFQYSCYDGNELLYLLGCRPWHVVSPCGRVPCKADIFKVPPYPGRPSETQVPTLNPKP